MNQSLKNIVKYLVIFAILGVVIFFGVKLFFPEPSPLLAHENTIELTEKPSYGKIVESTNSLLTLMQERITEEGINTENYYELIYANNLLVALHNTNAFLIDDLAFAKNSGVYNAEVSKTSESLDEINKTYISATTYFDSNLIPFLNQNTPTISSLNLYSKAILPFLTELCEGYQNYTSANIKIVSDLEVTIRNNAWSKEVLSIIDAWSKNATEYLSNKENLFQPQVENITAFYELIANELTEVSFVNYYNEFASRNALIEEIKMVDLKEATKNVLTDHENSYLNSIENAQVLVAATNVLEFLKGEN